MKRLLFMLATFLQGGGQPVNIVIQNPSFDQPFAVVSSDQCGDIGYTAIGWQGGLNLLRPSYPNPCGIPTLPEGATVVAVAGYGSSFYQDLGVSPASFQEYKPGYTTNGFYTLNFYVANRDGGYSGYWTMEIDYGAQELCEKSGWGEVVFTQDTLICPSPGGLIVDSSMPDNGPAQGNQDFVLHFSTHASTATQNWGWPQMVTKFSLTFTPQS